MLYKKILICLFLILFYIKSIFAFTFLLLFVVEYAWILTYFIQIYLNWDGYFRIEPDEIDFSSSTMFEVWLAYCKLQAFSKIYLFFLKKKFNLRSFLFFILIILLGIPYRILKLAYYFINSTQITFRDALEALCFDASYLLKDKKIEILGHQILLNCHTLGKLLARVDVRTKTEEELVVLVVKLQKLAVEFWETEKNCEKVKFEKGVLETHEGERVFGHYTLLLNGHALHATSNTAVKLQPSQFVEVAIPTFIKPGSKYPGTVASKNIKKFLASDKFLLASKPEVNSAVFKYPDLFPLTKSEGEYAHFKHNMYMDILLRSLGPRGYWSEDLVKELSANHYNFILKQSSIADIREAVHFAKKIPTQTIDFIKIFFKFVS